MRRQNLSCDLCRRSKRRCTAVSGDAPEPPQPCRLCSRFGRNCTYEFSRAQSLANGQRRRKARDRAADVTGAESPRCNGRTGSGDTLISRGRRDESVGIANLADDALKLPIEYDEIILPDDETCPAFSVDAQQLGIQSASFLPNTSTCWRSPAAKTLTRFFTRQVIKEKQAVIHNLTLGWTVSQYLSYSSNPFMSSEYALKEGSTEDEPSTMQIAAGQCDVGISQSDMASQQSHTVNGMARFLDSFADVYGNPLSRAARVDAVKAFEAVMHAWSMQWLFEDHNSQHWMSEDTLLRAKQHRDFYASSWLHAHGLLVGTRHSPSFTRTMAVFLFNMAETSECVITSVRPGETPVELQDHALVQLKALLTLAAGFAETLPADSSLRSLFDSAVGVMHWYGYVRDTSVAILHERSCILNTIGLRTAPASEFEKQAASSTATPKLEAICQAAATRIIRLKRTVTILRDGLSDPEAVDYADTLQTCCEDVSAFNSSEGASLEGHLARGSYLSPQMQGCAGDSGCQLCTIEICRLTGLTAHLLLSWSYGVLTFVQCVRSKPTMTRMPESTLLEGHMEAFERHVLACVARLAAHFSYTDTDTINGDAAASSGPSLVARNSNIPLVATMLTKFLECTVAKESRAADANVMSVPNPNDQTASASECRPDIIANLLKSLLSLSRTVMGCSGPQAALRSLMARYPDQLMSVWTNAVVP